MLRTKAHHCFAALKGDAGLKVAVLVVAFPRAVEIKHSRRVLPQGELTYGEKKACSKQVISIVTANVSQIIFYTFIAHFSLY